MNLDTPYKNRFDFPLALPSFIWPAGYRENVDRLGPLVDEVALLFFESKPPQSPPDAELVNDLVELARRHAISYNIHLPVDVDVGHPDPSTGDTAVAVMRQMASDTRPLHPSAWVLHIEPLNAGDPHRDWINRLMERIETVLSDGMPSKRLCVETLHYPLEWLAPVIDALDLGICLDIGHLFHHDLDPAAILDRWGHRIGMIHLHASVDEKDHQPLDRLTQTQTEFVLTVLEDCRCPVTVENFSEEGAARSLTWLAEQCV